MSFGGQNVFSDVTARVNRSDHIGLVGPNGSGKTTLLRLIMKELEPVSGHVNSRPGMRVGYLPQSQEYPPRQTLFEEVYSGLGELKVVDVELRSLEAEIKVTKDDSRSGKLLTRYADLTDRFELLGGSSAEARVGSLLEGLGIPRRLWNNRMESLSGGERNMVGLARILIGDHDLMLLDEPGNHLDFSGLDWLENFLCNSRKAFIIVSHNRYMLDRACLKVWELERGRLETCTGNYSDYRREKLTRQLSQESAYKRAQKEITRLKFNIQRLKAWSSVYDNPKLARTAKVFERRVEELGKVEKPTGDGKRLRFRFLKKPAHGRIALDVKGYGKQFEDAPPLLEQVNFLITQGERVAFVGDNGTGKSSLVKDIIREGNWEHPQLRVGKSVSVGYFSQLGENLESKSTVIEEAMRLTGLLKGEAADVVHRFLFTHDDLDKPVEVLSGGETARLQLAVLVRSGADMLLLDEPTNHLDIHAREAVEDALDEFPGTLVLISHDRYFLDKLADRILHFTPPDVNPYDGNFSEFWEKYRHHYRRMPERSRRKTGQKRQKFDSQRFRELEAEISRLEKLRPEVEAELRKLDDKGKARRAEIRKKRLENLDRRLGELYDEWLKLGEKKKKW